MKPLTMVKPGNIKKVHIEVIARIDDEVAASSYMKDLRKDVKKVMRTKYSEKEIDEIEFDEVYTFSEDLNRAGRKDFVKKVKNNKLKGYTPPEEKINKMVYGILFFVTGEDIMYDCSVFSDDVISFDEVV
jgi:hypothetical protein